MLNSYHFFISFS